ncbi:unnamed protein product [Gongylonema pulchrum]|uniref:Uncharacterized protein n=1 Tax=Gongylonema pulchrum TaxID=637853 RepID=A0A183ET31_9BILA|nr:unnamed protein product [Gongylonema pulchrum]
MLRLLLLLLLLLLVFMKKYRSFNICNVSSSVCVPLSDLKPNCTCILLSSPINVTNETNLYFDWMKIPLEFFKLQQLPDPLIARLQKRIPKTYEIDEFLDLSPVLYGNVIIDEYFWFLTAQVSDVANVLDAIARTGVCFY